MIAVSAVSAVPIAMAALVILFVVLTYADYRSNVRKWNNGVCPCEKGWWNAFDTDSSGATGYKCTECNSYIWIGWHRVTR